MTYLHKHFERNQDGRDFVVGDIHGCMTLFNKMLDKIKFDFNNDRMFSVGDLIDRGEDSLGCLKLIEKHWFFAVRGNHEDMMVDGIVHNYAKVWHINGGKWSLDVCPLKLARLCAKIERLPYFITVDTKQGDVGICHAEPPTDDWNDVKDADSANLKERAVWGRSVVTHKIKVKTANVFRTVHGHTPLRGVTKLGNAMFIDTGACFDGGYLWNVELGKL